jgi:hypothetical protein
MRAGVLFLGALTLGFSLSAPPSFFFLASLLSFL